MNTITTPKSYPYKPKKLLMIACIPLFGFGSWFLAETALTNDRGINYIVSRGILEIPISVSEATFIFWVLSVLSGVLTFVTLYGLYCAFTSKAQVVLTNESISIPSGIFQPSKTKTIPFNEILSLEVTEVHKVRHLKIFYQKGKAQLNDGMLPKKTMFDEIMDTIKLKGKLDQ